MVFWMNCNICAELDEWDRGFLEEKRKKGFDKSWNWCYIEMWLGKANQQWKGGQSK